MKNLLKSKAFLSARNIIVALVAVFLTAGAVTAIVISKNGGNYGSGNYTRRRA